MDILFQLTFFVVEVFKVYKGNDDISLSYFRLWQDIGITGALGMAKKFCQIGLPTATLPQKEVSKTCQGLMPNNYSAVVWTGRCMLQIIYFFPPHRTY